MLEIALMLIAAYCALNYAGIMCTCLLNSYRAYCYIEGNVLLLEDIVGMSLRECLHLYPHL